MKAWEQKSSGKWQGEFYGHRMSVLGMYAAGNDPSVEGGMPDFWVYQAGDSRMLYGYPDTTRSMAMKAAEQWASENRIKEDA